MLIQQLSIFVENKSGRLAQITKVMADAGVDIRALSIADTTDFGILRLIVDRPDDAVRALKAAHLAVSLTDVIAVSIDDKPGAFYGAMDALCREGVSVEYMYAFISRDKGKANVILRVEDTARAIEVLKRDGFSLLTPAKIAE